ncbi:putative membrane protein [Paraburkholderia xenovorans LB400]|jgi:branched-subunit amino acid ABC-type transport system permease component|uniref:Uncharacterized protein n=1 Tax=Paraburkholderia xenovorans (strain LB400) TaxID=266265 RepID=Q13PD6_PARXL|nr:hypothetical protein [Paraburkholderia xenovorans]ABE34053.1 Hypothetical protein Bxe_B1916 [Paraburkholderia xenovorans LB400]AIP35602.1 putative membrane protein [Paraburkholderia xenovorans LB400]
MNGLVLTLIFAVLNNVGYGLLLLLLPSGLTNVFGSLGVPNFVHAPFYMPGAYPAYERVQLTGNFRIALLIAPVLDAALGVFCAPAWRLCRTRPGMIVRAAALPTVAM